MEPDPNRPDKTIKRPTDVRTGHHCNSNLPEHQYSYDEAAATGRPVGFVFAKEDGLFFLDADNCFDGVSWNALAVSLCERLKGAAVEVSQSKKGLHFIGQATVPAHSCRNIPLGLELYTDGRFCALTQLLATGDAGTDHTPAIASLAAELFPPNEHCDVSGWRDEPHEGYEGPEDDEVLLRMAMASGKKGAAAAFGDGLAFAEIWNVNEEKLAAKFSNGKGGYDRSQVDFSLALRLSFWTGGNDERTRTLMMRSPLVRSKWIERPEWLETTIRRAASRVTGMPGLRGPSRRDERILNDKRIGEDLAFSLEPDVRSMAEALEDLVFVGGTYVIVRATKRVRAFRDAKREHAASKVLVDTGEFDRRGDPKIKEFEMIELWLKDPKRLTVDVITWAPGDQEFCLAPERQQGGDRAYNLWMPPVLGIPPTDWLERAQPFLRHIEYLVPIESEQIRFLQWLGHIFQLPGELPHTCYLMIATETGIGRGTLASILTRALRGFVAANMNIDALFGGFNGRISQKLLATVDEVREGHSANRYANAESFKSKITEEFRALNPKYGAQSVEKNCCRWLMFSNHLDALPFDNNDRRVVVIANPSDRKDPEWYVQLHSLMDDPAFIASIQHYFSTIDLSGFSPHEPAAINEAKLKALSALESDVGRACKEFKALWPDELATVADFRRFLGDEAPRASRAFQHEFERAEMRPAGRVKITGTQETVLIVKGPLTPDDISTLSKQAIAKQIASARQSFWSTAP